MEDFLQMSNNESCSDPSLIINFQYQPFKGHLRSLGPSGWECSHVVQLVYFYD